MKKKVMSSMTLLTVLAVTVGALAVSLVQRHGSAKSPNVSQAQQKKLRELAMQRDVEVEGNSGSDLAFTTLASLKSGSKAIVYGRIMDSKSFFDESGQPAEYGEVITTEYTVEVLRVLKDTTLESMPSPGKAVPAPLTTPLKIARNGGVVNVNGHRAAVKVKGFEALGPGKQYVFFMNWSPDYKAYVLTSGIFGAVMVNGDLSLKPVDSSDEMKSEFRGIDLDSLANEISRP
ncbi:MAG: hypothetical protein ND866_28915 [Pyrinomonadaceae bacterium]|nr:hypothetical protein [Pyrinomonadaceae bacterium]